MNPDRLPCPYKCEYPGCEWGAHKPKVNWNGDDTAILCTSHIKSEVIGPLVAALREAQAQRDHATRAALYAMNQRDEQRRMKEGNITALDTALVERNALQARLDAVTAILDNWPANPQSELRAALAGADDRSTDQLDAGDEFQNPQDGEHGKEHG